jgi:predicted RNA binding protein YcfA (HicA-like mRNA interferase family)
LGKRRLPGALTADDLKRVVLADGWVRVKGTKHLAYEHPTKTGKVNIDENWEHVIPGGWVFNQVLANAGLTRKEFERLFWKKDDAEGDEKVKERIAKAKARAKDIKRQMRKGKRR